MANSRSLAIGLGVAFTLLTACNGPLTGGRQGNVVPQAEQSLPYGTSRTAAAQRGKDLLYASSVYSCNVYVFTYPSGKLLQTLNACGLGFGPAFGLCSDRGGDVFMAMGEGFSVFEFAHGGTKPIGQLQDDSLLPVGCSVDPKTGDLGVASVTGNLAIYKNASGTPVIYSLSDISEFYFCTYDDRGNLFADGQHGDGTFALAELPKDASALREITLDANLAVAYALQWDGRHVVIEGTQASNAVTLDRIHVAGSIAKVIGTTTLTSAPDTFKPVQFWIRGNTIVQPENGNVDIGFWKYPRGGDTTKSIPIEGATLSGVTVSVSR